MSDSTGVSCPDCGAKKNEPCVYLWPKDYYTGEPRVRGSTRSPEVIKQMDRAGTTMVKTHNGRAKKARHKKLVEASKAREAAYAAKNAPSKARDEIIRANAAALTEEHRQLRDWLKSHATILVETRP